MPKVAGSRSRRGRSALGRSTRSSSPWRACAAYTVFLMGGSCATSSRRRVSRTRGLQGRSMMCASKFRNPAAESRTHSSAERTYKKEKYQLRLKASAEDLYATCYVVTGCHGSKSGTLTGGPRFEIWNLDESSLDVPVQTFPRAFWSKIFCRRYEHFKARGDTYQFGSVKVVPYDPRPESRRFQRYSVRITLNPSECLQDCLPTYLVITTSQEKTLVNTVKQVIVSDSTQYVETQSFLE